MGSFVNRTGELDSLEGWWSRPGPGFGVVWGRRRVGKSWLLAKFAENRRTIIHTARARPLGQELALLSETAAATISPARRSLADRPFRDWDDAFEVFAAAAETQPLLVILDEFPGLLASTPNLEDELRAIWDRVSADSTHLKVLICGSSVRVMEAIQAQGAALFGRADLRLHVRPFRPHEAATMLAPLSPAERAAAWGVCGGIPRYLAMWDAGSSFNANLQRLVCDEQGLLLSEGELALADEEIVGHRGAHLPEQVLRAVAAGDTTFSAIHGAVGKLPIRTLDQLVESRLLERVVPVTDNPKTSKTSFYRIADNFLAFWLRCVEPHRAQIERGLGRSVAPVITASFDDHMGSRYEDAFRDHLRRRAEIGDLGPDIVAVGEWWQTRGKSDADPCQLDAVVLAGRAATPITVGEAKWAKKVNGSSVVGGMRRKLYESRFADPDAVTLIVCARESVDRSDGITTVTAADIFPG